MEIFLILVLLGGSILTLTKTLKKKSSGDCGCGNCQCGG